MANPQCEDGYTKISNELLDAICRVNLSSHESRVLWHIIRKTYGYGKKADKISLKQFSRSIGLDRRLIHRSIKSLSSKQMIAVIRIDDSNPRRGLIYCLQKNYDKWLSSAQMIAPVISVDDSLSSAQMIAPSTGLSSVQIPTKENKRKYKRKPPKSPKGGLGRKVELLDHIKSFGVEDPDAFWLLWQEWRDNRIGKPWKSFLGEKKAISHLINLCGKDSSLARKIIDQSLANNWQGLFSPKPIAQDRAPVVPATHLPPQPTKAQTEKQKREEAQAQKDREEDAKCADLWSKLSEEKQQEIWESAIDHCMSKLKLEAGCAFWETIVWGQMKKTLSKEVRHAQET